MKNDAVPTLEDIWKEVEQIDSEEFAAAIKQLKLGNTKLADEFMKRMEMQDDNKKLNIARMGCITGFMLMKSGYHESAADVLWHVTELLL